MKPHILMTTAAMLVTLPVFSAVTAVENFESANINDDIGDVAGWTQNTDPDLTMDIQADPDDGSNKVLRVQLPSGSIGNSDAGAWKSLGSSISTSSTAATLFFQVQFAGANARSFGGLSAASTGQLATSTNFDQAAAYAGGITGGGGFGSRDGGTTQSAGSPSADTWYNVWLVVDNSSQTYDVYLNTGTANATGGDLLFSDHAFRTGAEGVPGPLDKLIVLGTNNSAGNAYFDNFILDDAAQNLNFQLVPEPSTYALLAGVIVLIGVITRRRN